MVAGSTVTPVPGAGLAGPGLVVMTSPHQVRQTGVSHGSTHFPPGEGLDPGVVRPPESLGSSSLGSLLVLGPLHLPSGHLQDLRGVGQGLGYTGVSPVRVRVTKIFQIVAIYFFQFLNFSRLLDSFL